MLKRIIIKIEAWLNERTYAARDAYLNSSQDIYELEHRMRNVERNRY